MKRTASIQNVALYARVSTKDGRQDTENQLIALREYCAKQGWQIAGEYVDHETGGTSKRPKFQQLFADARQRTDTSRYTPGSAHWYEYWIDQAYRRIILKEPGVPIPITVGDALLARVRARRLAVTTKPLSRLSAGGDRG